MARYIDQIGVEVECGIRKTEEGNYPSITAFNSTVDGSVNTRRNGFYSREYVSKPVNYKSDWDNSEMSELESGLYELYKKNGIEANDSMGLHIHISFYDEFLYHSLASEKFRDYFIDRVKQSELYENNSRLRERVSGVNYAEPVTSSDLQYSLNGGGLGSTRYRHFIYRKGMDTIEFRLFPAFESMNDVKEAINLVTKTINSYLFNKMYEMEESEVLQQKEEDIKFKNQNQSKEDVMEVFNNV